MKISDIVIQLRKLIPQFTDLFSTIIPVNSIIGDGSLITVVTTGNHNLKNNDFVNLTDVSVETPIIIATKTGTILKLETGSNTDLTFSWPPHEFVTIVGFTDTNLNKTFKLISSDNRRTFEIDIGAIPQPTLNGNEVLLEKVLGKFNGPQLITVVNPTTFTFPSSVKGSGIGGLVKSDIRIAGLATIERIDQEYTENPTSDLWMFVVPLVSANVNKSRNTKTDLNNEDNPETDFEQYILDGFAVYVYSDASDSSGGLEPMDVARSEVFKSLLNALRGFKPPAVLSAQSNQVVNFLSHGTFKYDGSVYVHQFNFQFGQVMTSDDAVLSETVAFRDIPLIIEAPSG